jgi:predicted DNA repair protein MutK
VVDDTAVTPQYVHGIAAERELPIIKRIAIGSLRNKLSSSCPRRCCSASSCRGC